jgi:hypothetical protein
VLPKPREMSRSLRVGGYQTPDLSYGRTAWGVRIQNLEIKYKKPTTKRRERAGKAARFEWRAQLAPRGEGGLESLRQCGRVTARVSRTDFFCGSGALIIFIEIKEFKRPCVRGRETSQVTARTWAGPCAWPRSAEAPLRDLFSEPV